LSFWEAVRSAASWRRPSAGWAIESRVKLKDLASAIHVYPIFGFVLQQIAAQASLRESLGGLGGRVLKTFVR
jgi:hypothetical protein